MFGMTGGSFSAKGGAIPLDKQTTREDCAKINGYSSPNAVHEKRFETSNTINTSCSKYRNADGPAFYK